ncbi:hypothetical protein FRB99_006608 [Tulasnella sp. 403]|nr:hypothetical protein FRB99_006608 [Tulasnella sp. 403]
MNRRNITVEDTSPVIDYSPSGAWGEGSEYLDIYSGNSIRVTSIYNATVSLQFNGTGAWVYGAKRNNHGSYLASIDGITASLDGFINNTIPDNSSPIFSAPNLEPGIHTVSLKNVFTTPSAPFLNIDKIVVEIVVPDQTLTSIDDTESHVLYTPDEEWVRDECTDIQQYSNATCRITSSTVGTIQLAFQGDTIAVIGGVGPDYGSYNVSVDSNPRGQYNAKVPIHHAQQVLYLASGLGSGNHTLKIQNKPNAVGNMLDLDQIQVFGGNATALTPPPQTTDSGRKVPLAGPITGAIVGALALAAIAAAIVFYLYRRRQPRALKALDLGEDDSPAATQIPDVVPDPYVNASVTDTSTHSSYPPTSSQWNSHRSPSTTNLMESVFEPGVGRPSEPQRNLVPLATAGARSGKPRLHSREPSYGIAPPPYEAGNS